MKIACSFVLILAFCAQVGAQQVPASTGTVIAAPASKKRAPRKKTAREPAQAAAAATAAGQAQNGVVVSTQAQKAAVPAAKKAVPKAKAPPVEEEEPGAVMIDPRPDEDRSGRFADAGSGEAETEAGRVPGGIPVSYGQLKGSLTDAGRSLLVFENADGEISFVQVFIGKSAVTWKAISNIRRTSDANPETE